MPEGGRNSLLESAQEATLSSVATLAFPRQCNRLPKAGCGTRKNRIFTNDAKNLYTAGFRNCRSF
jgi:hypothetical protein